MLKKSEKHFLGKKSTFSEIKLCLHITSPCLSPTKLPSTFNIVSMMTDTHCTPILPVRVPVITSTMVIFDNDFYGDGPGDVMCEQAFIDT